MNIDIHIIINMNIEDYKRYYLLFIRYSLLGIPYIWQRTYIQFGDIPIRDSPPAPDPMPRPGLRRPRHGGGWGDINIHIDINMNIDIHIIIHMNNSFEVGDHFQVLRVSEGTYCASWGLSGLLGKF